MGDKFLVSSDGVDLERLKLALAAGWRLAKDLSTNLTIVVPTISNAPNTILRYLLTDRTLARLCKGEVVRLDGVMTRLYSIRTLNEWDDCGVLLALWGGQKMLDKIDMCQAAQGTIVFPTLRTDIARWQKKHNAVVIE